MRLRAVDKGKVLDALNECHGNYGNSAGSVERLKRWHITRAIEVVKMFNGELTEQWVDDNIMGPETQKKVKEIISLGYLPRNANMAKSEFNQVRQASHSSVFCLASYTTRK